MALAGRYLSHEWKSCPRRGKKINPNTNNQSQTTLDLANPCNSVKCGGSGGWRSPVAAVPFPSGSSSRPGDCRTASGLALPSALARQGRPLRALHTRPALGPAGPGVSHAPVPGPRPPPAPGQPRGPASATLHGSLHPLEHGWGWFLAVCVSLLCGGTEGLLPAVGEEGGAWPPAPWGIAHPRAAGAHTWKERCVPWPWLMCLCDRTCASRLVTPYAHPSAGARRAAGRPLPPLSASHLWLAQSRLIAWVGPRRDSPGDTFHEKKRTICTDLRSLSSRKRQLDSVESSALL